MNKKMYESICGEAVPDILKYTQVSENFYHHSELLCDKACERSSQLRSNFKNARAQIESIQRSIMSQDDHKSEKIRQYQDQIWELTVKIKEMHDERKESPRQDEWSSKRIEMLEEEVQIKTEQLAACQLRIDKTTQELSEVHKEELNQTNEMADRRHAEMDVPIERCLMSMQLVLQTLMHTQTAINHACKRDVAAQESARQVAYEHLYKEADAIEKLMEQVSLFCNR